MSAAAIASIPFWTLSVALFLFGLLTLGRFVHALFTEENETKVAGNAFISMIRYLASSGVTATIAAVMGSALKAFCGAS